MEDAVRGLGAEPVVHVVLDDSWSTDRITPEGREKLRDAGFAPPAPRSAGAPTLLQLERGRSSARGAARPTRDSTTSSARPRAARSATATRAASPSSSSRRSDDDGGLPPRREPAPAARGLRPVLRETARSSRHSGAKAAGRRRSVAPRSARTAAREPLELGRLANEYPPVLRTRDRFGERIDEVEFHPAWHELLGLGVEHGLHSLPWREQENGHVVRAVLFMTLGYAEAGVGCPLSMTFAAVPALRSSAPELAGEWEGRLTSTHYEPGPRSHLDKTGALCGMAMTERQGGSDVRANMTVADRSGDVYRLNGEKWFCSAPMSDAFLVLAQARDGLTCFLLPRLLDDGTRKRLQDRASEGQARQPLECLGRDPPRGRRRAPRRRRGPRRRDDHRDGRPHAARLRARLDRAHAPCGRRGDAPRGLPRGLRPAADRPAAPEQRAADLCLDSEAATVTALRIARAFDEGDHAFRRLATAVAKYWVCKATPPLVAEALECLGGNGYVEESGLPRLYRESPVNSVWEGSGNVNCLDVLRRSGASRNAARRSGTSSPWPAAPTGTSTPRFERLDAELEAADEPGARRLVELLALCLQGSLLVRHAPSDVADAFCATRLGGEGGRAYGTLPTGVDTAAIVERHRPRLG
jgi:putative acyl-CoA dehydrogenase